MSGGNISRRTTSGASSTFGSPGTKAIPIPAITSRIEVETSRRLAATATTARIASMNSSVSMIAVMRDGSRLDEVGDHVHGQCENGNVEEERQHTVHVHDAADHLAGDGDVGDLRCHRNHKGEIQKVPIVRSLLAGKFQAADAIVAAFAIIFVRIVQGENGVQESPRQ